MAAEEQKPDVWNVVDFQTDELEWSAKSGAQRMLFVVTLFIKTILALLILYLFIISLGLMANSFRILGGKTSGRAFRDSDLFDNPLAGLVTGILVTVLVQSSSTSTSIIITMTAGDLIEVKNAIPMIMGANIGTSVTNTLVCLGSFNERDEYRRAFAGATVHDCFNLLTVSLLLPIEAATGLLRHIASGICDGMDITDKEEKGAKTDFLKKITKPVGSRLLGIDKKLITEIAKAKTEDDVKKYEDTSIIKHKAKDDNHIFMDTPMSDGVAGILMVFVSLGFLCICLMMLVKLLQTIFRGRLAIWFRQVLNLEFQSVPGLANYVLILFGAGITILFQSSSVTTSTLTPLAGIGLVRLDKMFAFTVGANIGTTLTGILGALVSDKRKTGLTVAFSHTLFNLAGTLIWYPIPPVRNIPISMAKTLGNIAADVKWFPVAYIVFTFLGLPAILLGLSAASPWACVFVGIPFILFLLAVILIIALRNSNPGMLPGFLKGDAGWMPNAIRVDKRADEEQVRAQAVSADLGANNWHAAPAAWGAAWFVILALLMVCFNNKWADMKYPAFDKRNHYGIGGWSVCSYAFEKDMSWAPIRTASDCDATLAKKNAKFIKSCSTFAVQEDRIVGFSSIYGSNAAYEKSWTEVRADCSLLQWHAWCGKQSCAGEDHKLQCQNVSNAVFRPYSEVHGPQQKDSKAWKGTKGNVCRAIDTLCTNVDGSIKAAADLSVVGLVLAGVGQICLLIYSMKLNLHQVVMASCGFFGLASIFLLASWAVFAGIKNKDSKCIVEADSNKGAVYAHGKFGEIINDAGSYTYGVVIGAWLLLFVPITLIVFRIKDVMMPAPKSQPYIQQEESEPVQVVPVPSPPVAPQAAPLDEI
jgi:sodium-dependent phosphate cotransporter